MSKIKKRCREEKYPEGLISGTAKAGKYFLSFPYLAPIFTYLSFTVSYKDYNGSDPVKFNYFNA
jgi:hypothetical protein